MKSIAKVSLVAVLILSLISCGRVIHMNESNLPSDIFYLKDEVKPFTGKGLVYFRNTEQIKMEMKFKNGVLHGAFISYYKNGQVRQKGNYENGQLNSKWEIYTNKGILLQGYNYTNDVLNGEALACYSTGEVMEKGQYQNNQRTGTWTSYSQKGKILSQKNY